MLRNNKQIVKKFFRKRKTLFLAFCVLFFESLNYPLIKMSLNGISPFFFLSLRFWLLALFFMPFAKIKNVRLLPLFKFALLFNVVHYSFNYFSFNCLSPTLIATFQYLQVPFLWMMIHKRFLMLLSVSICAILFIQDLNYINLFGVVCAIFSGVFWALGQISQKKEEYSISTFVFFTSLFSAPFLSILAIFRKNTFDLSVTDLKKMTLLLLYQIAILGLCKGLWAQLSYKEGRSIHTTIIWVLKPICVAILSSLLCVN